MDSRGLSLWFDQLPPVRPRGPLTGDREVDVAIVGAGFTGLWTAYYLQQRDPQLQVALVESQFAGFGASGRNGGWCSALFPVSAPTLAAQAGHDAAVAQYAAMRHSVHEVVRAAAAENIAADVAVGGTVVLARSAAQLERARAEVATAARYGQREELLDAAAATARLAASNVCGASYTPDCAVLQPARLTRGLADVVVARGAELFERTPATGVEPHRVHTPYGALRAGVVVRATEGYTARLPGHRRDLAPVYSLIVATEPLPEKTWREIGLAGRETFSDHRHLIVYGQRSADNRLVFGGRGAPYHFGSRIRPGYDRNRRVFAALEDTVRELLPVLHDVRFTHRWGGPLGIARDWHASVGLDARTGVAWAGGYVGDGVATTNLAGRTLADLITGYNSELTRLPWVGHRSRRWEPEPLRWLGVNAGLQAMTFADRSEQRSGRASRVASAVDAIMAR